MRKLDLQGALARGSAAAEDLEDEAGAVQHLGAPVLFEIPLLDGRKLGVDDDDLLCGLASPPLSSVIPDAVGAGRLAAELLERLMRGERLATDEWLLPPVGISTRQSTDVLAIDDPLIVAAVRHIREHACDGIKVADVARALGTTRRVLERGFARRLGHTPHEEIERVLGLGATLVNDLRNGDRGWAVLADPEGNEFCVLTPYRPSA